MWASSGMEAAYSTSRNELVVHTPILPPTVLLVALSQLMTISVWGILYNHLKEQGKPSITDGSSQFLGKGKNKGVALKDSGQ